MTRQNWCIVQQKAEQSKKTTKNQEQFADRQVVPELADKLTESEWRYFKKQVGHLKEGNHYEKSANGDIMIPVFNKLVYTDGKYNNPGISKIVEFNSEYENEIDIARRKIYAAEKGKSEIEEAYSNVELVYGEGYISEYRTNDTGAIQKYDRRTERGKSKSDTYHREFLQDRIRDANEVIRSASTGEVNTPFSMRSTVEETEVKFSDRNTSIKQQLIDNADILNEMDVVASIERTEEFKDKQEVIDWAMAHIGEDGIVTRQGFGNIVVDKKRVRRGLSYLKTFEEKVSVAAIRDVLVKGVDVAKHSNHKGRLYDTLTFASPVLVNGSRYNMAVVVRQADKNYYKVHRLLIVDETATNKKDIAETAGGVNDNSGLSPTDNVFDKSISQNIEKSTEKFSDRAPSTVE